MGLLLLLLLLFTPLKSGSASAIFVKLASMGLYS
jgi:hypothetical protein